jgi:hypothetical protein
VTKLQKANCDVSTLLLVHDLSLVSRSFKNVEFDTNIKTMHGGLSVLVMFRPSDNLQTKVESSYDAIETRALQKDECGAIETGAEQKDDSGVFETRALKKDEAGVGETSAEQKDDSAMVV